MRLYSPVDSNGNVNMIEKLVLGGTGAGAPMGESYAHNSSRSWHHRVCLMGPEIPKTPSNAVRRLLAPFKLPSA